MVGRTRRDPARAAQFGVPGLPRHRGDAGRASGPTWSRSACQTRPISSRRCGSSRPASRCSSRSRWSFDLEEADALLGGGGARTVLRHQLQPPLRPSRCGSPPRRSTRGELGRPGLRDLALRGRGGHRHAPARQPDRDPVPRLRHARAPVRADRLGDGPDDRPDRDRLDDGRGGAALRQRRGRLACSARTTARTPIPAPTSLEVNGTAGPGAGRGHRAPFHAAPRGRRGRAGVAGRLFQRHRSRLPRHLRPPPRRASRRAPRRRAAAGAGHRRPTRSRSSRTPPSARSTTGARVATPPTD